VDSLRASNINVGLREYDSLLQDVSTRLRSLKPTSIIALARKGPRLWQMMMELGYELPDVPVWSDYALDFLQADDLGHSPVIFDDVSILGTSLYRLQNRIRHRFAREPRVVSAVLDRDNFKGSLVSGFWSSRRFTETDTQRFSSELIRAIPLLGLPYDLDHPVFTISKASGYPLFSELARKATAIHAEHLSLQYADQYAVTVLHFEKPNQNELIGLWSILGNPQLLKLKVYDSRHQSDLRFVSVNCFSPLSKSRITSVWKQMSMSFNIQDPLVIYRLFCFAAAWQFVNALDERLREVSTLWQEADLVFGCQGVNFLKDFINKCPKFFPISPDLPPPSPVADKDIRELGQSFDTIRLRPNTERDSPGAFERICNLWGSAYREIELDFRRQLKQAIVAGTSIDGVLQSSNAKRLQGGLTAERIFDRVQATDLVERSLAMDLAVDSGVQVPVYAENNHIVGRVYHHGESVWDGIRFAALIAKVFDAKKKYLQPVNVISTEKWLVILYELAVIRKVAMFSRVVHFLENPNIEQLSLDAIQTDNEYRQHGRTLEVAYPQEGLRRTGERRWSDGRPAIYWLKKMRVLKEDLSRGRSGKDVNKLVLAPDACERFQAHTAVPADVYRPVSKLFGFLAAKLPPQLKLEDGQLFDRQELLRLLSSCATRRQYLRSIAEDTVLIAQRWHSSKGDPKFWNSKECRGPSGEIYQKWRAFFFKDEIVKTLRNHYQQADLDDDFELLISPLFNDQEVGDIRSGGKIEDRALTLFLCIESIALQYNPAPDSNKQKAITWLQNHGFTLPLEAPSRILMAERVCQEVLRMFSALITELEHTRDITQADDFFVFSDMRDSSVPEEMMRAEKAKCAVIQAFRKLASESSNFHFNDDLNDEKDLYADNPTLAKSAITAVLQVYSSHDKYARFGIVSSRDTLEKAAKRYDLPSSPTNYALAKKIAHHLVNSDDVYNEIPLRELDKRRAGQRHGVFVVSRAAAGLLDISSILGGKQFEVVTEFLGNTQEGWVHVIDSSVIIGDESSPELHFSVYLYR